MFIGKGEELMGFMGMVIVFIFAFIIITTIILIAAFFLGIVLLIIGNIQKRRSKYADRIFPKVIIIVGTVFTVIPLFIGGYIAVMFIRVNYEKSNNPAYEIPVDESKNENLIYTRFLI